MGTESTFQDNAGGIATTARTLHPAEMVEDILQSLPAHCIQLQGSASSVKTYGIRLGSQCRHCMEIPSTFRDMAGGSATNAATLHPAEVALQVQCNHRSFTAFTVLGLHECFRKMPGAQQPPQEHCSQLKWHCRCTAITAESLHPASWAMHHPS